MNSAHKLAAVREPGYPVGMTAPCWFTCPCGATHRAFAENIDCPCGQRWTADGYRRPSPGDTERVILNGIPHDVIAEAPLGPLGQAADPACLRMVTLRRPNGHRLTYAKDYGQGRYRVLSGPA